uniref:peptidase inhibitor 16 n=1 Tax=Jaculus jaculus TaxID=51337 RepID=UPI001E1B1DE6|nr:peptidase inhibitor 16 [Jaculus jaculus]
MHRSRSLGALWPPLLLLLLLVAATGAAGALTEDEKRAMVELHNLYRAQVSPAASNMLRMRWDPELAAFAEAYAQKCVWGHNKERGRRGENLFAITDEGMDVPLAMEEWHQEREYYNLSAAACDPGQMCGHYTQVVWGKTERIGCGSHFCETLQGVEETNIQLLVCNYEPPGNVRGQRPYQEGPPCSRCPPGYRCEDSLCEPTTGLGEAQDFPLRVTEVPPTTATSKTSTPSLATETTHLSVTEVPGPRATEAATAVETKAPSSLATEGSSSSSSMATETPPSLTTDAPTISATSTQLTLHEGADNILTSTHIPVPKSTDKITSKTGPPSLSPERSLYPKMAFTGTGEPLPRSEEESLAELPLSRESLAFQPHERQASLDHSEPPASKPSFPSAPASANASGGRTLALQSSWPGAEAPDKPGWKTQQSSGHAWSPFPGLWLLLPPLLLAGFF